MPGAAAGAGPAPVPGAAAQPEALAATDPIMMPEPAPAPDPIEEELKAPMKAADPAPGSIGSAVSGPATDTTAEGTDASAAPSENPFIKDDKQTPSVAFNDPAAQADPATGAAAGAKPAKKKSNKTTLIALIAVAAVIVIVLIVILVMQVVSSNNTQTINVATPANTINEPEETTNTPTPTPQTNGGGGGSSSTNTTAASTLSCARNMTAAELAKYNDALSGTVSISVGFGSDMMLATISMVDSVVYNDENATKNEPVEETIHEATSADIDSQSALIYSLPVKADGTVDLSQSGIQANYESLDYVCRVL